jgi:hypothetical protein
MHPFFKRAADLQPLIRVDDPKLLNLLEPDFSDYLMKVDSTLTLLVNFNDKTLAD